MRIIGIGADFVKIDRINNFIANANSYGLSLVFSNNEINAVGKGAQYMAGRFAVKEALLKAAHLGFTGGLGRLSEIDTRALDTGAPKVRTRGKVRQYLNKLGVESILVTLSHDDSYAFAVVVLQGS